MWFSEKFEVKTPLKSVSVNFMPSWWYKNYGIEYGNRMVFDADYRIQTHQLMRRFLSERFKNIGLGDENPSLVFVAPEWQNALTQTLLGAEIVYAKDAYPVAKHLKSEAIDAFTVPHDLCNAYPYNEIIKQTKYLNNKYNFNVNPILPLRGVLNEAVQLGGTDFLADLIEEECDKFNLLDFSYSLICKTIETNLKLLEDTKDYLVFIVNCTAQLIGPALYSDKVFKYDCNIKKICDDNKIRFGLHHCGNYDNFLELYNGLGNIDFLEVGSESDLEKVCNCVPNATISYIVDNKAITNLNQNEFKDYLYNKLIGAKGHYHRLIVNVADLDFNVPDENIAAVYEVCSKI
jgi:hypothetical protein